MPRSRPLTKVESLGFFIGFFIVLYGIILVVNWNLEHGAAYVNQDHETLLHDARHVEADVLISPGPVHLTASQDVAQEPDVLTDPDFGLSFSGAIRLERFV